MFAGGLSPCLSVVADVTWPDWWPILLAANVCVCLCGRHTQAHLLSIPARLSHLLEGRARRVVEAQNKWLAHVTFLATSSAAHFFARVDCN